MTHKDDGSLGVYSTSAGRQPLENRPRVVPDAGEGAVLVDVGVVAIRKDPSQRLSHGK